MIVDDVNQKEYVEEDNVKIDQVELGDEDFKSIIDFNWKMIKHEEKATPPFVILIGCEASSAAKPGYDISSKLIKVTSFLNVTSLIK